MTIGHLLLILYLPPYHPLGCHLNVGSIYLKKSENSSQWSVKISSVQTLQKITLHLHLSNRGGTDLLPVYYFLYCLSLLYLCMLYTLFWRLFIGIYLASLSIETAHICVLQRCRVRPVFENINLLNSGKGHYKTKLKPPHSILAHKLTSLLHSL